MAWHARFKIGFKQSAMGIPQSRFIKEEEDLAMCICMASLMSKMVLFAAMSRTRAFSQSGWCWLVHACSATADIWTSPRLMAALVVS